jgi:hypothetical protein
MRSMGKSIFAPSVQRLPDEPIYHSDPPHNEGEATVFMIDEEAIVLCRVKRGGRWRTVVETYRGATHEERVAALAEGGWEYVG